MVPTYELTGEKFHVLGRGTSYTACLLQDCSNADIGELVGTDLAIGEVRKKIIAVDSIALHGHLKGAIIGILVNDYD